MRFETALALILLVCLAALVFIAFGPALDHELGYKGELTREQREDIVRRW